MVKRINKLMKTNDPNLPEYKFTPVPDADAGRLSKQSTHIVSRQKDGAPGWDEIEQHASEWYVLNPRTNKWVQAERIVGLNVAKACLLMDTENPLYSPSLTYWRLGKVVKTYKFSIDDIIKMPETISIITKRPAWDNETKTRRFNQEYINWK